MQDPSIFICFLFHFEYSKNETKKNIKQLKLSDQATPRGIKNVKKHPIASFDISLSNNEKRAQICVFLQFISYPNIYKFGFVSSLGLMIDCCLGCWE